MQSLTVVIFKYFNKHTFIESSGTLVTSISIKKDNH